MPAPTPREPGAAARHVVVARHPSGDGEALYVDGKLVEAHHDVSERLLELFGVEVRPDVDFLHGETRWSEAFKTLDELDAYAAEDAARQTEADELRRQADELRAQADELLKKAYKAERTAKQ